MFDNPFEIFVVSLDDKKEDPFRALDRLVNGWASKERKIIKSVSINSMVINGVSVLAAAVVFEQ